MQKKEIGYYFFSFIYKICCLFRVKQNRIFLVMTHDSSEEGNVGVVKQYLQEGEGEWEFCSLKRQDTRFNIGSKCKKLVHFFIKVPYQMATSSYIFQDNVFLPMAFMKRRNDTKIIQLWHGTGTIKKFGQDVNVGRLKELESRANQTITHLIVNSEQWKERYAHIFAVDQSKVFVTGMPRTDLLFQEEEQEKRVEQFYEDHKELIGKKLVLYAPTFRDQNLGKQTIALDVKQMLKVLPKEVVIGLRLHPFVANQFQYDGLEKERVIDLSKEENVNSLLFASTALITDYSSIIFEYIVLNKPIYFFAYDLEEFSQHGRGFYEQYECYVPGPISKTTEQLLQQMQKMREEKQYQKQWEQIRQNFQKQNYMFEDGNNTKRLIRLLDME